MFRIVYGGYNNIVFVPIEPSNRHERRQVKKTGQFVRPGRMAWK